MPYRPRPLAALVAVGAVLSSTAHAQKAPSAGVFKDAAGKTHVWQITPNHALMWEGQPFVPVGGTFASRYLAEGQTEENWAKDVAALDLLKSKGVQDLIIDPLIPAPSVPVAAWQKLVDKLEAGGFRYGLLFGSGITVQLTGTVVKPSKNRQEDVREGQGITWRDSDATSIRYYFVDANDGSQILHEGSARVRDGEIVIPPNERFGTGTVGVFYPYKRLKSARQGGLNDIWTGFDAYRDKLLATLGQVKFGPGLRFFLDPLGHSINLQDDETDFVVPDSPSFRLEWEAWLTREYPSLDVLMNSWGLQDRTITSFTQASHLIPLAANNRGLPYMLDPDTGKRLETRGGSTNFWANLREFRDSSLSGYMHATADLLKREIAEVPVIYTRINNHRIYTNKERGNGFDGLGIAAYGRGSALITGGAESVVSQAESSNRSMWCVVTETADSAGPVKETLGIPSRESLFRDLDILRGVGAKGFYVNSLQALPEASFPNYQIVKSPDQLTWLKEYNDKLSRGISVADVRSNSLLYPEAAAGYVHSGPIGGGSVWWVPSLAPGKQLLWGNSYSGYTITLPEGEQTVIWSLRGPRQTRLIVGDPKTVKLFTAEGLPIQQYKVDNKRKSIELVVPETPIIIRGNENEIFPAEAAEDAIVLLKNLLAQVEAAKLGDAFSFKLKVDRAMNMYKLKDARLSYAMAADAISSIVPSLQPYTWLEAEKADNHTFSEVTANPAASGESYLTLSASARPGPSGYGAEFKFNVPADDTYSVWIACTPPGPQTSPFAWLIDTEKAHVSTEGAAFGSPYLGNRFVWVNLGRTFIRKGSHSFTLRVTEPAADGKYSFAFDTILVTRSIFTPNGTTRPTLFGPVENLPAKQRGNALDGKLPASKNDKKDKR